MKKILLVPLFLLANTVFAQAYVKSDDAETMMCIDDGLERSGIQIQDKYGTVFGIEEGSIECGCCSYAKWISWPYESRGELLGCESLESLMINYYNGIYTIEE